MVLILRKYFPLILLLFCFIKTNSQTGLGINTVVIDPGHGGKDPGAVSPNKNFEKTVVLKVSLLLGELIKKEFPDVKVILLQVSPNRNEHGRAKIANEIGADLFISVHANAY